MVARVRSQKFCCCLPVRLGVIIIALLGLVGGSLIALGGIYQLSRTHGDLLHTKLAYIIQIGVYALYALMSIFGLIGAFGRKRGLVSGFHVMLVVHVLFSIASGSFSLYRFFQDSPDTVRSCINGSSDSLVEKSCEKGVSVMKGVMVGVFVFVWLMEIWGTFIVKHYVEQLDEEEAMEARHKVGPMY